MAYTRVTNTRNGASAIRYAFEEPSHKKGMDRVLMASGSNLDPNFAMQQMRDVWKAHGKDDGKTVQMYRVIQSFDLDQLDPSNPDHIAIANEIGKTLASELYPDKQALIVTQADGKGGKLHNHVLVNSVGFVDGKSLRGYRKEHDAIAEKTDEIMQRHGLQPIDTENTRVKRTSQEKRLAEAGKYVWKDDLRGRVDEVLADVNTIDRDTFKKRLKDDYGVDVTLQDNRKHVTYEFVDNDGKQRRIRNSRLGTDYGKETLDERLQANYNNLHEMALVENRRFDEMRVQPVQVESKPNDFGFDLDAELSALTKPKRPRPKATRTSGVDEITERIEARRLEKQIDEAHQNALIENAHIDALRENVQFDEQRAEEQRRREEKERQEAEAKRQQELKEKREQEERDQREREKERLREMLSKIMPKEKHHLLQDDSFLDTYKEEFLKTDTQAKPMERVVQAVLNAEKPPEQRRYDHEKKSVQVVEQVNDELQQQDEHELEL